MNTQRWEHERRGPKGKMNKTTGVSAFLKLQPVVDLGYLRGRDKKK